MKLPSIKAVSNLTTITRRAGSKAKRYSPEIKITIGIIGSVASTVIACKATTKLNQITEEHKATIKAIEENDLPEEEYTVADAKKDKVLVKAQTTGKIIRLYAPAAAVELASILCVLSGHRELRKRLAYSVATCASVAKAFDEYRERVVDRYGEEVDRQLRYNISEEKTVEYEIDPETGKTKKIKSTNMIANIGDDPFTYIFSKSTSAAWTEDMNKNLFFLRAKQEMANVLLHTKESIFLNDILDDIGMEKTYAGQILGWVDPSREKDPVRKEFLMKKHKGDSYVDFGAQVVTIHNDDGDLEDVIVLNFNCDGDILNGTVSAFAKK